MLRLLLLAPALASAAFLGSAPVAATPAPDPQAHFAYIEFGIPVGHGLHASIETSSEGVTLEVAGKHRFVTYRAQGESTEAGLKARFGDLGLIDVAFTPVKTTTYEPPRGCTGPPSTSSVGLFTGTIDFTGEREYVRIATTQVKGTLTVWRESESRCHHQRRAMSPRRAGPATAGASSSRSRTKRVPASLGAIDRRCGCLFAAFTKRDGRRHWPSFFYGLKVEETEGMEITRVTYARGGAKTFAFNHAAGTARLHPPLPFSGNATFKRRPHARDLWRSTIEVPLLGVDSLSVRAPAFRARLVRASPGGE